MIPALRCPRCERDLAGPSSHGGPGYRCEGCGGRAVTLAGLRRRHTPSALRAVWQATSPDREIGCPACHARMLAVKPDLGEVPLALDVCRRCQLVWFDADELDRLPALEITAPRVSASWPSDGSPAMPVSSRLASRNRERAALDAGEVGWIALDLALDLALDILD